MGVNGQLVLAFTVCLAPAMLAGQVALPDDRPRPPAEDLARALQQRYDRIRDFSADFTHTYEGGVLRRKATERGKVLIKKPGKMRWTYEAPEDKLFVSDGARMYSYVPSDRQVIVTTMPSDEEATSPALFLAGKGNLVRDFTSSYAELAGASGDAWILKFVPRQPDREFLSITMAVDDALRIRVLETQDAQGGRSRFEFANLKENLGLSDKVFTFTIPRGVDVITDGRSS
jgi:outer membrane lipoprotein carrier protein